MRVTVEANTGDIANTRAAGAVPGPLADGEPPRLGIGIIGGGFIGRAHAIALRSLPLYAYPPPAVPELRVVAEASGELAAEAPRRLEIPDGTGRWEEVVERDDVDVVAVATPNSMHREVVLAALERGKHVMCEKPLGVNAKEALDMYRAAKAAGVVHSVAFNYRRVPAVTFARQLIQEGRIGAVHAFRGKYLYDGNVDPRAPLGWRQRRSEAGGALGDIGSHVVDLARYLVGEIDHVTSAARTWTPRRPLAPGSEEYGDVEVDDEGAMIFGFRDGALGVAQVSMCAPGRRNNLAFEVNGELGSIEFDYERMNELRVYLSEDARQLQGFRTIRVASAHPYGPLFYQNDGFGVGFTETKVIEWLEFLGAVVRGEPATPDFYDGYLANCIIDRATSTGSGWISIEEEPR
jgi:predicted dehydrogenase